MLEASHPLEAAPTGTAATPRPQQKAPQLFPLRVDGLLFKTAERRLIDNLSVVLEAGPRTVILGPNGAGKSLLLRLLHGLLQPHAGAVCWGDCGVPHGKDQATAIRKRQAMVFQRPILLRRSAAANLRHALRTRGLRGTALQHRIQDWLERAELSEYADSPARRLSTGEQQRLALARALSGLPEVLLLDEPTANLDPLSTLKIERLLLQAHAEGTHIILVTHDLGQARRMGEQVLFLHRGRLEEKASAADFFAQPQSTQARHFLQGDLLL